MTVKVFAWPPVGVVGAEWTEDAPAQVSHSLITGAERYSATQRIRRVASLRVSSLALGAMGAGYMEMLKRHLAGIHCVRLYSYPINWALDVAKSQVFRQSEPLAWTADGTDLDWTADSTTLLWYTGSIITGTTGTDADGWPIITVAGLPASTLVARPGEFITAFVDENDTTGTTVQITMPATSDASGNAVIRLFEALPAGTDVRVSIGVSDTGVFRPVSYPRSMQPTGANWYYDWEFREVFADEVGGSFTEVDPWR